MLISIHWEINGFAHRALINGVAMGRVQFLLCTGLIFYFSFVGDQPVMFIRRKLLKH